jgi:hypothetical protein
MTDNSNRSDPGKEEIEKELSIIFDSQICVECGQDHSFKNSFENVKTSIDYLPVLLREYNPQNCNIYSRGKMRI